MIIVSSEKELEKAREIIQLLLRLPISCIIIVGTQNVIRELGRELSKDIIFNKSKKRISLVVFKENYPEENALKIMIKHKPDIVIDCDYNKKLHYLKGLAEVGGKKIFKCNKELIEEWFM